MLLLPFARIMLMRLCPNIDQLAKLHWLRRNMGSVCEALSNSFQEGNAWIWKWFSKKKNPETIDNLGQGCQNLLLNFLLLPRAFIVAHRGSSNVPTFSSVGFKISFYYIFKISFKVQISLCTCPKVTFDCQCKKHELFVHGLKLRDTKLQT